MVPRNAAMLAIFGIALSFSSCASRSSKPAVKPTLPVAGSPGEHYQIAPGDLLTVTLAGEPDYNQQVRVDWNGRINVPNLTNDGSGEVPAAGLSPSQLAERLSRYAREQKVFVNPRVQVIISDYVSQAFTVLGQVNLPGRYNFPKGIPPRLAIEEAVAIANGYTRLAKQTGVMVRRGGEVYRVNLRKLIAEPGQPSFVIIPGDVITVPERMF